MLKNFEVTRIEVSGSKAYALKHYWDFMGFSTYIFQYQGIKIKIQPSLKICYYSCKKKTLHVQMLSFGSSFSLGHFF